MKLFLRTMTRRSRPKSPGTPSLLANFLGTQLRILKSLTVRTGTRPTIGCPKCEIKSRMLAVWPIALSRCRAADYPAQCPRPHTSQFRNQIQTAFHAVLKMKWKRHGRLLCFSPLYPTLLPHLSIDYDTLYLLPGIFGHYSDAISS